MGQCAQDVEGAAGADAGCPGDSRYAFGFSALREVTEDLDGVDNRADFFGGGGARNRGGVFFFYFHIQYSD